MPEGCLRKGLWIPGRLHNHIFLHGSGKRFLVISRVNLLFVPGIEAFINHHSFHFLTFQCSLCDNSFCQQANLDRHVRKHQDQATSGTNYKSENTSDDDDDEFVELVDL
jgi:hypothetical protein